MLKQLYVKDFILFDEINLDFKSGFSVFTGETGAGKSILVDAIGLLCADRASASYIRKGKDKAIIEGVFDFSKNPSAIKLLEETGLSSGEDIVLTREIKNDGKSIARIDHRIVNLSLLKELLRNEIDIHSQRESQYLLQPANHRLLLDKFIGNEQQMNSLKEKYLDYKQAKTKLDEAVNSTFNEKDIEYFKYEIQEISDANVVIGEDEQLDEKLKQVESISNNYEKISKINELYNNYIQENLYEIMHIFKSLDKSEQFDQMSESTNDIYYNLNDIMEKLNDYTNALEVSEEDIDHMNQRLYTLSRLKRKYGGSLESVLTHLEELNQNLQMYENRKEVLEKLQQDIDKYYEIYINEAKLVSKLRHKQALVLDKQIIEVLNDLMLPNASFKTQIDDGEDSALGFDHVEFLITMNKDEQLRPLQKVASGGELSRLTLGLKSIFNSLQGIHTVIFDEIDTGVSGPVATSIGLKMSSISKNAQVIAVTHLAPVAACADYHYFVSKKDNGASTSTNVELLNQKQSIEQLALIASGSVTPTSIKAAEELYKHNQSMRK